MERKITVKGKGTASLPPDRIVLSFNLSTLKVEYQRTMELASKKSQSLLNMVTALGFKEEELKTTTFDVTTKYKNVKDKNGNYTSHFLGYECKQSLRLEFRMDFELLSKIIQSLSDSAIEPNINISFTLSNPEALTDIVLQNATEDALRKAKIMTEAAGTKLGQLLSIDYNWGEINIYSSTNYDLMESDNYSLARSSPHIVPEDIEANDTVTFVWALD